MNVHHSSSSLETPLPHDLLSFEGRVLFPSILVFFSFDLSNFSTSDKSGLPLILTKRKPEKKCFNLTGKTIIILIDHNPKFSHLISICILSSDFQQENSTYLGKAMVLSKCFEFHIITPLLIGSKSH